jgi:predicted enzyme related to lactoylglutathione lyase
MAAVIAWFEIPSKDFERSVQFYNTIMGAPLARGEFMGVPHGFFRDAAGESHGAVIKSDTAVPAPHGPLLYLHVDKDLASVVERVAPAGGEVITPVTSIGEQGSIAVIRDTEGNQIGLHTPPA